jgi:hypothetical protein
MWSRIRKETGGAGLVADMQGLRGKRRKVSGVSRIRAKGVFPGAQEGRGPLVYPPKGKCYRVVTPVIMVPAHCRWVGHKGSQHL